MKKTLLVTLILIASSCNTNSNQDLIIGKWKPLGSFDSTGKIFIKNTMDKNVIIEYTKNRKYKLIVSGNTIPAGSYKIDKNILIMKEKTFSGNYINNRYKIIYINKKEIFLKESNEYKKYKKL